MPRKRRRRGEDRAQEKAAPGRGRGRNVLAFAAAAVLVASYAHLRSPNIPDPDSFGHLRHASLYLTRGLGAHEFPWVAFSVISSLAADIWYGFHLLLIPFAALPGPVLQIKVAGIFLLTAALTLLWWALRRLGTPAPWLWPFVLLLACPGDLWRMAMTRPHVLSIALGVLLLSFIIRGRWWQVGLVALALTFLHLNFFWLAGLVVLTAVAVKWAAQRVVAWPAIAWALAGCAAGWLLRPNPLGALKLLHVQVFELMTIKRQDLALPFGRELLPMEPASLLRTYGAVLALWLVAVGVLAGARFFRRLRPPPEQWALLWSSLALSGLFFGMTMFVSRRAADLWAPFAVILVAAVYAGLRSAFESEQYPRLTRRARRLALAGAIVLGAVALNYTLGRTGLALQTVAVPPQRMAAVGAWLREHAPPGAVVFNLRWDHFPELFYYNPDNRYIGGMDPIFQYAYDQRLYWKAFHLAQSTMPGFTCGAPQCTPANREDIYAVLRRDFDAFYLVLNKWIDPVLYEHLGQDRRFIMAFDDGHFVVVQLAAPP